MIRFILKAGFFLGLVALLLPKTDDGTTAADTAPQFDVFTAMMGAQAAIADLAGFCDRAPAACSAGGAIAQFAGERIGDGIALAYSFVEGETRRPDVFEIEETGVTLASTNAPAPRDPVATGAIRRDAPLAMPAIERISAQRPLPVPAAEIGTAAQSLPIPRPAPRA
ncbi:DUF5330 domain-containing protein [Aurantimonas endophytica]|uniref:DUF5330 domain-containing protein n=1 Tax=Aurantimonas endophytica TaxID=1522175 RepID=A0A7W6HFQ9_9HYPH|nr:DUF5330 domain-containing protein [Aurantimonas endophytica]MBB4004186.1 hypothetical protein [Aurantimonas endophytica]MCO6405029.1 hypothetical protein [Aurantimonas endophytica]